MNVANKLITSITETRGFLKGKNAIQPLPHLIIMPGTLRAQWAHELQSLFRPHSIDILLYDSTKTGNPGFWAPEGPFHSSKQQPQNIVILMAHSVCDLHS